MKTIDHHKYELESLEGHYPQTLQFIHKEPLAPGVSAMRTLVDGTTNEEVLRVVIDRVQSMNEKFPCRENSIAVTQPGDGAAVV